MKVAGIIPARFKSSRFPGKPIVDICGKPMIIWVYEAGAKALGHENTYVATDDLRIAEVLNRYNVNTIMTHSDHLTGTDRIAEAATRIEADVYLNIQGDEPLLDPADIIKIVNAKKVYPEHIINGYTEIKNNEDPNDKNIPKLVLNSNDELLYMSRSVIPGSKGQHPDVKFLKQVCIYAFSKNDLNAIIEHKEKTPLEAVEDIEILRFLELGYKIKMIRTSEGSLAVDIPSDIVKIENEMQRRNIT